MEKEPERRRRHRGVAPGSSSNSCCLAEAAMFDGGCCVAEAAVGSACFVATAAHGTADHPDLRSLRAFRDQVLRRYAAGRAFIVAYYAVGPYLAAPVRRYGPVRVAVRDLLVRPAARLARRLTGA